MAIDDHTRMAYAEVLTGQSKDASCAFRERSIQWFEEVLGAPVRQVMTDNGHAYRSHDWRHACAQLDIEHIRTRPYTPRTNGKAERLIKTMLRGLGLPLPLPHKCTPHPSPCGLECGGTTGEGLMPHSGENPR